MVFSAPSSSPRCVRSLRPAGASTMIDNRHQPPLESSRTYRYVLVIEALAAIAFFTVSTASTLGVL